MISPLKGSGGTHIVVGPPGTGKTTFLATKARDFVAWARWKHPETWRSAIIVSSLTTAAAAEIGGRGLGIPRECVSTLHAHAYRSLGRPEVAEGAIDDFNERHKGFRLTDAKRQTADTDQPSWDRGPGSAPGDEFYATLGVLRSRQVDRALWPERVRLFAAVWDEWKAETGRIDFVDMIHHALLDVPTAPGNPHIIIGDEAQDWSSLEFALARKWGAAAGNLILCGDPDQAIYEWRGANPHVLEDPTVPAERRRTLDQSYRIPRAVHRVAMRWRQNLESPAPLEYSPRDDDGFVENNTACWKDPTQVIDRAEQLLDAGKSVMFLSSCSFVVAPTVSELRRRAIPFANPWRRTRGDWNPLQRSGKGVSMIDRLLALLRIDPYTFGDEGGMWTWSELHSWSSVLSASGLLRRGQKRRIEAERDSDGDGVVEPELLCEMLTDEGHAALQVLIARAWESPPSPASRAGLVDWWASHVLPRRAKAAAYTASVLKRGGPDALTSEPKCFVGSVHSFKGAEADVVIVFPDLSPAGWVTWGQSPGPSRDSVVRLFYVALTRAREGIVLCRPIGRSAPVQGALE